MEVVSLEVEDGVATVCLEDRVNKNTFSKQIIHGLIEVFSKINRDISIKAVIIHGYDGYFCCGGTKEELIGIFEGNIKFTDMNFYNLLLECNVPVISAMQGHALGGGLVFGCYADIVVMSEQSIYSANFMKYGFTPGMGGTLMIPEKFGAQLGNEMLMTAANYYGHELMARGASVRVVLRGEVIDTAKKIASDLSDKPRESLVLLKNHMTKNLKDRLPSVIEKELAMHEISFGLPEVKSRIESLFGERSTMRRNG